MGVASLSATVWRDCGALGKSVKEADCGSKRQPQSAGLWWEEGHGPQQQGGSCVRGRERQMSPRCPHHSSQHLSVTAVCVPLKINATHVDAEMHHTGPLFLLVLPFPRKMPQKEKNLAGLKMGSLHLGSLSSLMG